MKENVSPVFPDVVKVGPFEGTFGFGTFHVEALEETAAATGTDFSSGGKLRVGGAVFQITFFSVSFGGFFGGSRKFCPLNRGSP